MEQIVGSQLVTRAAKSSDLVFCGKASLVMSYVIALTTMSSLKSCLSDKLSI